MARPPDRSPGIADIFRAHGAAWRKANAGHLSLGQLKAMSAIETCRTAALDVAAERGSATGLDRRHDLQLGEAHVTGVGLTPRRPMDAKDVGDLEGRPRHAAVVRRAFASSA